MSRDRPDSEITQKLVRHFCDSVFQLKQVHYFFHKLFGDARTSVLLKRTAWPFFYDLNKILLAYFILEVAKLTDPVTGPGGKRENFSVANLIETVDWPPDCLAEVEELNRIVVVFRKYIAPARNRIISHYDKETVISGEILGDFPEGEDRKLLETLDQICNLFHQAAFGTIYGKMVLTHSGDVHDLVKVLWSGVAFEKLLSESKGEDTIRLYQLLEDVRSDGA